MPELNSASLDTSAETRTFDKAKVDVVGIGGMSVGRFTFEPGWRWSESVKPVVGTEKCEGHHVGVVVQGRMTVETDSGSMDLIAGDAYEIPPGHDAWIVGDETFVGLEFKSAADYGTAK